MKNSIFHQFIKSYTKSSIYVKIIFICLLLLGFVYIYQRYKPHHEAFTQREKYTLKQTPVEIYDGFYASIYDDLVYDINKNNFEVGEIVRLTKMEPKRSIVLDIGSGKGHHVNALSKQNIKAKGLDISPDMVKSALTKYPNLEFVEGDALTSMVFMPSTFTHILCLYFTMYYMKDKKTFLKNCYDWLKPGGYLALHLVNRDKFNPIINAADPFIMVSPQKYAKERITKSNVKFYDFQYKANFSLEKQKDIAYFDERFKDESSGHVRQNKHTFYMPTQKEILAFAKDIGFILHGKIDLVATQYEYQYIYILQKPE
jgi:SAM-dependent methyltransferase